MYSVTYWIAGDPLPKTRLVDADPGATPAEVCDALVLGGDIMRVEITYIQGTISIVNEEEEINPEDIPF